MAGLTRGMKNKNPGNLIKGQKPFMGEVENGTDPRFRQFETMEYGYRAMLKVLTNYINSGCNTIDKIINRYAPSNENNTKSYISFVVEYTNIEPTSVISADRDTLVSLACAISQMENGVEANMEIVNNAWELLITKKS